MTGAPGLLRSRLQAHRRATTCWSPCLTDVSRSGANPGRSTDARWGAYEREHVAGCDLGELALANPVLLDGISARALGRRTAGDRRVHVVIVRPHGVARDDTVHGVRVHCGSRR